MAYKIFYPKFSLSPDPQQWGSDLSLDLVEADDELHKPEKKSSDIEFGELGFTPRGLQNLGCLFVLTAGLLGLLYGPYPFSLTVNSQRQYSAWDILLSVTTHQRWGQTEV